MIQRIEVDGYRLLDGFAADLKPLTVIIGANAVGKSTLLDCLQCVAQCADGSLNTVIGWHWGMTSLLNAGGEKQKLSWRVTFHKPDNPIWGQLPLDESQSLYYEVVLQRGMEGQAQPQYELLRKPEPDQGYTDAFKYLEATPYRRQIYSKEKHKLVPFDEAVSQPNQVRETSAETVNGKALALPPSVQEPALLLSQIRFFNEFPIPSTARVLLANMAFYPGFDVTRHSNLRTKPAEIKPLTMLSPNGENLGTVLHEILTRYDYRAAANDIRDFLKAAYPSFEDIHCETIFGSPAVLARIREQGMQRSTELWELSDGMVRFLCLAIALLNPLPPPFVAIDEPEAGLHPRLLPIVADMIKTASERTQVLVTTHSPDLLNRFDIAEVAVMTRDEGAIKTEWHRPGDRKSLVQMLKTVEGETLGDLHRSGELEAMG